MAHSAGLRVRAYTIECATKLNRRTVEKALNELIEGGLLSAVKDGKSTFYVPGPEVLRTAFTKPAAACEETAGEARVSEHQVHKPLSDIAYDVHKMANPTARELHKPALGPNGNRHEVHKSQTVACVPHAQAPAAGTRDKGTPELNSKYGGIPPIPPGGGDGAEVEAILSVYREVAGAEPKARDRVVARSLVATPLEAVRVGIGQAVESCRRAGDRVSSLRYCVEPIERAARALASSSVGAEPETAPSRGPAPSSDGTSALALEVASPVPAGDYSELLAEASAKPAAYWQAQKLRALAHEFVRRDRDATIPDVVAAVEVERAALGVIASPAVVAEIAETAWLCQHKGASG